MGEHSPAAPQGQDMGDDNSSIPQASAEEMNDGSSESNVHLKDRLEKQLALLKEQIAQRKGAEEALRRESQLVKLLQEVAAAANQAEKVEEAFQVSLDKICDFTGWQVGHVYLYSGNGEQRVASARIWHCGEEDRFRTFREVTESPSSDSGIGWPEELFQTGQPAWILDLASEITFFRTESLSTTDIRAGFAFPIVTDSEVVAVLEFYGPDPVEPDEMLLQAMAYIGNQLGRVVERVRVHERLQRNQQLLANAERLASVGSWEWDVATDTLNLSDEMRRIYSLDAKGSDETMADLIDVIHPDDRDDVRAIVTEIKAKKAPFYVHHRVVRPDGSVRTVLMHGKPGQDESGELKRIMGTSQDVTDQREAEITIARRAEHLIALSEMGQTVTSTLDLSTVFEKVLGDLLPLLGAAGVFILLLEGDELVFVASNATGERDLRGRRVPSSSGVAGHVLRTGRAVGLYGQEAGERVLVPIAKKAGFRPWALLVAPLMMHDEPIGVIEAIHPEPDGFADDDLQLLEAAGSWIAIAIGNARLFEHQTNARQVAEMMRDANLKLTQSLKLPTVLQTLLDHLVQLIGCDTSSVKLKYGDQLVLSGVRGRKRDAHRYNPSTLPDNHPLKLIYESGQSLLIRDTASFSGWDERLGHVEETRSWLGVPLLAGGHLIGVYTAASAQGGYFTEQHMLLAEALAGQAAIAVQNARLFDQVQQGWDRQRYLTRQVVTAQEEERRRVSRELHDEAGQALTALKISLELIRDSLPAEQESTVAQLADSAKLVDATMEQIRLLAHNLRPPVLDSFGLNLSLQGFCLDFAQLTGLKIHYEGADLQSLSDAIQISFYRFVQEALNNVAKHAQANEVWVKLWQQDGMVSVSVRDNGQGIKRTDELTKSARFGVGLIGMEERFELLGGCLKIESTSGAGTKVVAKAPLGQSEQEESE